MPRILLQLVLFVLLALPAYAQDWVVSRVRGTAHQMVGGEWIPLVRGAVVLDGQSVRTGADGRLGLARGAEVIELDPGTEILLHEGQGKLTSLEQVSGVVTADVERRNVQHFSIQTPFLAAVVKGTRFRVTVDGGLAHVEVDRGTVQVQDTINDLVVDIGRGQEAQVSRSEPLEVTGAGTVAVFTFDGQRVVNGTSDVPADEKGRPFDETLASNGNGNSGQSNAGGNGNGNGGQGNGNGNSGSGNSNAGGNGNGNGGQGNGNAGGNGNGSGAQGSSNAGGNGSGNSGQGSSNAGGNGNGNSGQGNGNSGSGSDNGGGNGRPQG